MPKPFGEQMKEARRRKGLTQEDLAKQMSVSRSTVSHWEIGRKVPEKEFLDRLTQLLEEEFIFDQEAEPEDLSEEPIESREVTSAEEDSRVIRELPKKQVSLKACIVAICAAILLTSLVSWLVFRNWTPQDVERISFVILGSDTSGDPLEYQGYIELEYQIIE
ncbi:MAG: helix-turn-helix domain-containing protein [Clostridia bacterium]|nr:helix-turn-helix domain-containing protein [Clostridia bacterium]